MTTPARNVERRAVQAVRDGDRESFGTLVELHQRQLFGLSLMMVRDPAAAEEVAQDAFVRAYTRLDLYDENRPFYPWLAAITVRLAQNWLQRHTRVQQVEGVPLGPEMEPVSPANPLRDLITDEDDQQLWRSVAALPSGQRTAVYLHYRQDMKVRDVAQALGVTSGTVKTLLFRARRNLRQSSGIMK